MQQQKVSIAGWAWGNEGVTCFVIGALGDLEYRGDSDHMTSVLVAFLSKLFFFGDVPGTFFG